MIISGSNNDEAHGPRNIAESEVHTRELEEDVKVERMKARLVTASRSKDRGRHGGRQAIRNMIFLNFLVRRNIRVRPWIGSLSVDLH